MVGQGEASKKFTSRERYAIPSPSTWTSIPALAYTDLIRTVEAMQAELSAHKAEQKELNRDYELMLKEHTELLGAQDWLLRQLVDIRVEQGEEPVPKQCYVCHKGTRKRCTVCHAVYYRACQRHHWSQHKVNCVAVVEVEEVQHT